MAVQKRLSVLLKKKQNEKKKKSKKKNTKKTSRRILNYTEEALKECLESVRTKQLSICQACKKFGIPKSTVIKKIAKNENSISKTGPPTVLTQEEEEMIVTWIVEKARIGYPMHPKLVKAAIQSVLNKAPRTNPFKNNIPGDKWFRLFLKRHPEISLKHYEVLSKSRASVTEAAIREWFNNLNQYLKEENAADILDDSTRIFNMDEIGIPLCPRTGKLLGETRERNNYYISPGQDKENITVLPSYSAAGETIRPMIVYPYKRFPPKDVAESVPPGYVIGHSPSGYMTADTFAQFIKNGFYEQLCANNVKFPVLLLFDGHRSHISMDLHEFCKSHGIILYLLYPNSTHILQPCDVAIFKPLKVAWRQVVAEHSQNSTAAITKVNFAPLFNEAMIRASDPAVIKKSFQCCGLYPFNPDAPNYSKCITTRRNAMKHHNLFKDSHTGIDDSSDSQIVGSESPNSTNTLTVLHNNSVSTNSINILQAIEMNIPSDILNIFKKAYESNETPPTEIVLYNLWKGVKSGISNSDSHVDKNDSPDAFSNNSNVELEENTMEGNKGDENVLLEDIFSQCSNKEMIGINNVPVIVGEIDDTLDLDLENMEIITEIPILSSNSCSNVNSNESTDTSLTVTGTPEIMTTASGSINSLDTVQNIEATPILLDNKSTESNNSVMSLIPSEEEIISPLNLSKKCQNLDVVVPDHFNPDYQTANNYENHTVCIPVDLQNSKQDVITKHSDPKESESVDASNLKNLWKQELHFPSIVKSKKKPKTVKPKIFAITSEAFKQEQEEKTSKQIEQQKLKELKKFEREMKKKIKQEEIEVKKKEKMKLQQQKKLQEELIKEQIEAKYEKLLKQKAEMLKLTNFNTGSPVSKKPKILSDISNVQL